MKIFIIETGGTIGSEENNGIISPTENGAYDITEAFGMHTFVKSAPYKILSENLTPEYWSVLIKEVSKALKTDCDGIIIFHGSDTLAYTSALLGLYFADSKKPIVITAANKPRNVKGSNAMANLNASVCIIEHIKSGVFTTYQNSNSECEIFLSTRIRSADVFTDDFSCIGKRLGIISNNELIIENKILFEKLKNHTATKLPEIEFKNQINVISPYPGFDYTDVIKGKFKAVLHLTYHSSTACSEPFNNSAYGLLEKLKAQNKALYLAPTKKDNNEAVYSSTDVLLKAGAIPMGYITAEAAYAKLLIYYNLPPNHKNSFLNKQRYFEKGKD